MVAEWFAAAIKAVYTVISIIDTSGEPVVCPQLGAVVSAAFTLGGLSINSALTDQQEQHQHVLDRLANMRNSFLNSNGTIVENQEILKDLQIMLNKTAEETQNMLQQIQLMLNNTPEANQKMMKAFVEPLNQTAIRMDFNLRELENIIAEHKFRKDTKSEMNKIWRRMLTAMRSHNEGEIKSFKQAHKKYRPHEILYDFTVGLEDPVTNPVVSPMKAHVLESRKILENNKEIFSNMVVQVLVMEGFYCGVAEVSLNKAQECRDEFSTNVNKAISLFYTHVTTYKTDETLYWPNLVTQLVESSLGIYDNLELKEPDLNRMVDQLHNQLNGIHTTDVFSIYAWNYFYFLQGDPNFFTTYFSPEGPQIIYKYAPAGSLVEWRYLVVMRSKTFHEVPSELFEYERIAYQSYAITEEFLYNHYELKKKLPLYGTPADPPLTYFKNRDKYYPSSLEIHELATSNATSVPLLTDENRKISEEEATNLREQRKNSSSPKIQGFAAFNSTPVARFTNKGYSILREEDMNIPSMPHNFIGLSWL